MLEHLNYYKNNPDAIGWLRKQQDRRRKILPSIVFDIFYLFLCQLKNKLAIRQNFPHLFQFLSKLSITGPVTQLLVENVLVMAHPFIY